MSLQKKPPTSPRARATYPEHPQSVVHPENVVQIDMMMDPEIYDAFSAFVLRSGNSFFSSVEEAFTTFARAALKRDGLDMAFLNNLVQSTPDTAPKPSQTPLQPDELSDDDIPF